MPPLWASMIQLCSFILSDAEQDRFSGNRSDSFMSTASFDFMIGIQYAKLRVSDNIRRIPSQIKLFVNFWSTSTCLKKYFFALGCQSVPMNEICLNFPLIEFHITCDIIFANRMKKSLSELLAAG